MDRRYWYWINNIDDVGNAKIRDLMDFFENPEEIANATEEELKQCQKLSEKDIINLLDKEYIKKAFEDYERISEKGIQMVFPDEKEYPESLSEIYDKPFVLYYKGQLPKNKSGRIAIVGSRKCTPYGEGMAEEISRELVRAGAEIISGLALGIDAKAHSGALMAGGRTYGILAGDVNKCYPMQNYNLYMDMIGQGGVISEFCEGKPTKPGMFPIRNRIISGLCEAVIIVEAGARSGSLITADFALQQNREIYAVPGRMSDRMSVGCNEIIDAGARIITSVPMLIKALGLEKNNTQNESAINMGLAPTEKMLYSLLLDFTPKSLESLATDTKLTVNEVFTGLLTLEMRGLVREISKNFYVRIH